MSGTRRPQACAEFKGTLYEHPVEDRGGKRNKRCDAHRDAYRQWQHDTHNKRRHSDPDVQATIAEWDPWPSLPDAIKHRGTIRQASQVSNRLRALAKDITKAALAIDSDRHSPISLEDGRTLIRATIQEMLQSADEIDAAPLYWRSVGEPPPPPKRRTKPRSSTTDPGAKRKSKGTGEQQKT